MANITCDSCGEIAKVVSDNANCTEYVCANPKNSKCRYWKHTVYKRSDSNKE